MKEIKGVCPIVAAPFDNKGELDVDSFQSLVEHLMSSGARALTLFGLATEFYKLTEAEKQIMQETMLKYTAFSDTVAGIVSITDHSWEVAVRRAQAAEAAGADALMVLPPFFLGVSEEGILQHLQRVLQAVQIPVIVQYAPLQTGVKVAPGVFLRLKQEHDNLRFVKVEAQPPGPYVSALVNGSGGQLSALVGYAGVQMPDALERGAAGLQPGCSFTEIYVELYRLYEQGQIADMLTLHTRLLPYISYWMQGVELIIKAEKIILQQRGIIASDYCRAISYQMDQFERERIDSFCKEFAAYLK